MAPAFCRSALWVLALAALGGASEQPITALGGASDPINGRVRRAALLPAPGRSSTTRASRGRDLGADDSAATYAPVRIRAHFGDSALDELTSAQAAFLRDELMPAVARRWAELLSVSRVDGVNLTLARPCETYWPDADGCVASCASVPADVYCGSEADDAYNSRVPDGFFASYEVCSGGASSGCTTTPAGAGAGGADFVLFVTAFETASCEGATLAYAGNCFTDALDRPVAGYANFCPSSLADGRYDDDGATLAWADQFATGVHETAHALGFSGGELAYFRHENGTVRSPRDACGAPLEATVTCPTGAIQTVAWPANSLELVSGVRGGTVAYVTSPAVRAVARDFFACDTLVGAELENQPTSEGGSVCWGSHWEERLSHSSVMGAILGTDMSALTLAWFEDAGWYRANFSAAGAQPAWGYHAGCAFANDECLSGGGATPTALAHPFCNGDATDLSGAGDLGCSADYGAKAYCSVADWSADLDARFQYFDDARVGGDEEQADFCPYMKPYSNGDCASAANAGASDAIFGEAYGAGSACMLADLIDSGYTTDATLVAGCFAYACDDDAGALRVTVGSQTKTCVADGDTLGFSGFSGTLTDMPCEPSQSLIASSVKSSFLRGTGSPCVAFSPLASMSTSPGTVGFLPACAGTGPEVVSS